jgi:hypothetical protein
MAGLHAPAAAHHISQDSAERGGPARITFFSTGYLNAKFRGREERFIDRGLPAAASWVVYV